MVYDQEVNRALAREMYIENTVNEVNPRAKGSPSKIKPGQMNLFKPVPDPNKER